MLTAMILICLVQQTRIEVDQDDAVATMAHWAYLVERDYALPDGILMAIAWRESKFDPTSRHDRGRGCGLMGILADLPGRPCCEWLENPYHSILWAAQYLDELYVRCGSNYVACYNGSGPGARQYQRDVLADAKRR